MKTICYDVNDTHKHKGITAQQMDSRPPGGGVGFEPGERGWQYLSSLKFLIFSDLDLCVLFFIAIFVIIVNFDFGVFLAFDYPLADLAIASEPVTGAEMDVYGLAFGTVFGDEDLNCVEVFGELSDHLTNAFVVGMRFWGVWVEFGVIHGMGLDEVLVDRKFTVQIHAG